MAIYVGGSPITNYYKSVLLAQFQELGLSTPDEISAIETSVTSLRDQNLLIQANIQSIYDDAATKTTENLATRAEVVTARDAAIAAKNDALSAALISNYFPGARSYVPRGLTQASVGAITGGSGGANGTFDLAWTGGNFTVLPSGKFTVSGGVLTAITIDGPGLYVGTSPTAPTPVFTASAGLNGAGVALTAQYLRTSGQYYLTDHTSDPQQISQFQNQGNAAVLINESVQWANMGRAYTYSKLAVGFTTYSALSAFTSAINTDVTIVDAGDTATHASVSGDIGATAGQTPNAGKYQYSQSLTSWVRIGDSDSQLAANLITPLTAINSNMSSNARSLTNMIVGSLTTAGTSNNTLYAMTKPSATIPVRSILNSVKVDVTVAANVTVVVMEPAWRNVDKFIYSVTADLAVGDGKLIDLGKKVVFPGTRIYIRINSGTLRYDAAAAVQRITWSGFTPSGDNVGTVVSSTGVPGMEISYSPLLNEIDTSTFAALSLTQMQDRVVLTDKGQAGSYVSASSVSMSADSGTNIGVGSIITGWSASLSLPNDTTQAEDLLLVLYEKSTSDSDIDTIGAFQSAGRPIRIARVGCSDIGLIPGANAIGVSVELMPYTVLSGKTYTWVLMGRSSVGTLAGKFNIATSGSAATQRRRGWWINGSGNTYAGLTGSSFSAGLVYNRERSAGDPPSSAAISAWDNATMSISQSLMARKVTGLQKPTADYNLFHTTGQSIAQGGLTRYALSTTAMFNNKMLGGNVGPALSDGSTYPTFGAAVWNNMVAIPRNGTSLSNNASVTPLTGAVGEPWNLAWLNSSKASFNDRVMSENDARIFCTINTAIGSKTIEQLSKVNNQDATNRFNVIVDGFTKAKTASGSSTICLVAVAFGQGENDYDTAAGSINRTRPLYKAKLSTYFDDIQAEAVTRFGQTKPAAIFSYATSGNFVVDTDANGDPDLFVNMAQLELSNERNDVFMVGPAVYPYPELVSTWHQTANAARWYGEMLAKVTDIVVFQGLDWKPVQPLWARKFNKDIYIGFHVPVPPLTFANVWFTSTYEDGYSYTQHGFKVIDRGNGNALVAATVTLAGKTIVKLSLVGEPSDDLVIYAAPKGPVANGNGHVNLRDSDPTLGRTNYIYDSAYMDTAEKLDAMNGKPYELQNWAVPFSIPVGYTADYIEWDDSVVSGSSSAQSTTTSTNSPRVRNTTYTAVDGDIIEADTTSGTWTLTLPATGGTVTIRDYAGTWSTNNLTIAGNGATFSGDATFVANVSDYQITFTRQGPESGWRWTVAIMNS